MRARHGHGMGIGLPLDLIWHLLGPSLIRHNGEIEADKYKCNLCGKCQVICRSYAIQVNRKRKVWVLYPNRCNLCLQCVSSCPTEALDIVK